MALISRIGFTLFDRWGENLGRLPCTAATHTEALDGTDELKVTCSRELSKGQRVVWVDRQGKAHEHLVDEVSQVHDDGGETYCKATCINSIAELLDDYIEDKRPSGGVAEALTSVLGATRWEVGTCDREGSASHTFYHVSVREALSDLVSTWGGEVETAIETDGAKVTHRRIGIRAARGNQDSPKRFTWTKDIVSIERTVGSANPKTRVYGYGKGVETDTGGYGRRLTFGDINDGKDYVEDAEATKVWGHPDGAGGILPAVDVYINEQCEDAEQLLAETREYLASAKEPAVSYKASVLDLYAYGRSWEGVGIGDRVAIIDRQFSDEGIRLRGRVSQIERDLMTAETTVTFGNLTNALTDMWETVAGSLKSASSARANYDAVASPSAGWLSLLQSALNEQFNAAGTYKVESFELGQVFSNVALNPETGTPVKTTSGMWAVNISGMGIRLASSLTPSGEWDWATFITGSSVNADCINAGTLRANIIKAGILTDLLGLNYWNLDTGEFSLSAASTVGGKGIATSDGSIASLSPQYAEGASRTTAPTTGWQDSKPVYEVGKYVWQRYRATMQDGSTTYTEAVLADDLDQNSVFNRLTRGGTQQGIYLKDGKVYVNGEYIKAGTVSTSRLVSEDGASMVLYSDTFGGLSQSYLSTTTDNGGTTDSMVLKSVYYGSYNDDGSMTYTPSIGLSVSHGASNMNNVSLKLMPVAENNVPDIINPAIEVAGTVNANTNAYISIPHHGDYGTAVYGSSKAYLEMIATEGGKATLRFHSGSNWSDVCQINAG